MRLYVMRHGPAEDTSSTGRDHDRALTASGRERVRAVARALVAAGHVPTTIVASPLLRARETAEIVHREIAVSQSVEVDDALSTEGDPLAFCRGLVTGGGRGHPLVVGHEPDLSHVVLSLTGRSVTMDKATVVAIDFDERDRPSIAFRLDPRTLAFLP